MRNFKFQVKVACLIGVHCALRISELAYLDFEDVRVDGPNYVIHIGKSKTDQAGVGHDFIIAPSVLEDVCPCRHISSYIELFDCRSGRFFKRIGNNGKPCAQAVGVNKIAKFPQTIADFLGVNGNFTGHTFRRSSATILADHGASVMQLKRLGRWRSSTVAESYVDSGKKAKTEASMIINGRNPTVEGVEKVQGCVFNNCGSIIFNFNK